MLEKKQNLEEVFSDLFKGGTTGTGEEELLRLASKYSMQLYAVQIKCLLFLDYMKAQCLYFNFKLEYTILDNFIKKWLEWKEYNNSANFILRIIGDISMRRFLTEQSFKVDIKK